VGIHLKNTVAYQTISVLQNAENVNAPGLLAVTTIKPSKDPFTGLRVDPNSDDVKKTPGSYVFDECDTCGRKFAYIKHRDRVVKHCCESCEKLWTEITTARPDEMIDLYFYKVKVPDELSGDDIGDFYCREYSWLELNIILMLKRDPATAPYLVEKIFGLSYTATGQIKHRSALVHALTRLVGLKIVRKYATRRHEDTGRPPVKYALTGNIVTTHKKCPHCKNNNYRILKAKGMLKCIYCGLEWTVPGVKR
jgi:hypothetical protein